jgi:hypothetical protein
MVHKMKKGKIVEVHDMGTMWSIVVEDSKGKKDSIYGDWRPMRDGLDSAFDISSPNFPYVSGEKIRKNVIGKKIKYTPEGWSPE